MKKETLRAILRENKVPEHYYNLDNTGEVDQRVCLDFDGETWMVYYFERGKMFNLDKYQTEDEACTNILNRLVKENRLSNIM
ncbi:hypothetical protein [Dendrosporobacter sp. 1207_IL3150]|uniref:hypothetical protein n=1 Tax=Dendrosporobacter sp. 1207_IL3150 TaxID=3084054 RepID=UPI002FD9F031